MSSLRDLDLARHLADPTIKQRFVTPMFDLIAPGYDRFTRLFSFGMDAGWKRELVAGCRAQAREAQALLDLACGTGDLAFALQSALPGTAARGLDASPRMIELAIARAQAAAARGPAPQFAVGDMMAIDADDASVDLVSAGYGFRNTPDHRGALREVARVLRPGGILATLDFYRPESTLWRGLFLWYLRTAGNVVGWLWHREPVAYGYIGPSIEGFVSVDGFSRDLSAVGLEPIAVKRYLFGGVALHLARRVR
jgi:demethylmenaquinone methyltransferase/2-methoxy-6-polyprenyl-1,4-benzoquinol methylase